MHRQSTTPNNRRRLAAVAAVCAAGLAATGVYATTLTVTANQDAGGAVNVVACDTTLDVQSAAPVFDEVEHVYKIDAFTVGGIAPSCDGLTLYATALNASGTAVQSFSHVYVSATDAGSVTFTFTAPVASSVLDGYALALHQQSAV